MNPVLLVNFLCTSETEKLRQHLHHVPCRRPTFAQRRQAFGQKDDASAFPRNPPRQARPLPQSLRGSVNIQVYGFLGVLARPNVILFWHDVRCFSNECIPKDNCYIVRRPLK